MTNAIHIRRATLSDLNTIVAFSDALFHEDAGQRDPSMNLEWAQQEGAAYFGPLLSKPGYFVILAESGASPVGYLVGYVRPPSTMHPRTSAELESMFVNKEARAHGVGRALAQTFLEWAKTNGAARVVVTAYAANENAVKFYQSLGFLPKQVSLEASLEV